MEGSRVKNMWGSGKRILEMWNTGRKLWQQEVISAEEYFYSSGNFTVPKDIISLKITLAGGGGGAAGAIGAVYVWGGGGGGGGGRVVKTFTPAEIDEIRGKTFSVIVGAAGLYLGANQGGQGGSYSQFLMPDKQSPRAWGGCGGNTGSPGSGGAGTGGENGDEILTGGNGGAGSVGGAAGSGGHGQVVGDVHVVEGTLGCGWGGGTGMPTGLNGAQGAVWIEYSYFE